MRISDIIKQLQEIKNIEGDLDILHGHSSEYHQFVEKFSDIIAIHKLYKDDDGELDQECFPDCDCKYCKNQSMKKYIII